MKVFISHTFSDEDQPLATTLQKILAEENIDGYLAEKKKEYDLLIRDKIRKEIENSDHMIAIVTNKARESASVNQEIGYALREGIKPVIMLEENAKLGVLNHGIEPEEFTRENFEKHCVNVRDFILQKGIRKKISEQDLDELIKNVYRPCYNQMKNIFERREFIAEIPPNPWEKLEHYWKLKTEPEMRELFENFEKELRVWRRIWIDFGNKFQNNQKDIAKFLDPVFEKFNLIKEDGRFVFGGSNHDSENWLFNCQDVIFNENISNGEELYQILKADGMRRYREDYAITYDIWKKDIPEIYNEILKVIPKLVEGLGTKYSYKQIDEQRNILKKSIEELTLALEEKLK